MSGIEIVKMLEKSCSQTDKSTTQIMPRYYNRFGIVKHKFQRPQR
jgi:hypothetical protein